MTNWIMIVAAALLFVVAPRAEADVRWVAQSSGGSVVGGGCVASGANIDIAVGSLRQVASVSASHGV